MIGYQKKMEELQQRLTDALQRIDKVEGLYMVMDERMRCCTGGRQQLSRITLGDNGE